MKIALDPTPFHHDFDLLEFPRLVADLGYDYLQLTPHRDFIPFFNHPRADDELVGQFRKACADAGVGIASVLPVLRWSGPDEDAREAAVRNWKRVIQITVDLGVNVINTEFSGRPEQAEESERAFFRSMEELLPIFEREGIDVRIDPHPDDFVEDGLEALRIIRGLNSPNVGMVYVACHTFHMGGNMGEIIRAAGDKLRLVHVADTMDHRRSHGLRYITNPPGNAVRVHQHLKIGDGDVDWDEFFGGLAEIGFYDRPDTVMVSSVFAEDENAEEVSRYQLATMSDYISEIWKVTMSNTISHWMNNKAYAGNSDATAPVTNPATGEVTGQVALASVEDARAVIDAAAAAFPSWRDTSLAKRTQILFAFRELLNARKGELAEIITSEHGKVVSDALGEVSRGQEVVEFACGIPHLLKGGFTENASTKVDVYSIRQPLGVVGVISPFNFPAMVPMWFFPIAIATGNTVVLKPVGEGPDRVAVDRRSCGPRPGCRPACSTFCRATRPLVDELLTNKAVKSVSFVGSTPIAQYVYATGTAAWQARAGPGRGQEPRGDPARRRPRFGRRRHGQRRLRLGRRTLHGHLGVCGRRADRRRPGRQDRRAHHAIEDR